MDIQNSCIEREDIDVYEYEWIQGDMDQSIQSKENEKSREEGFHFLQC